MSQDSLDQFGAYRMAMELFDLVVEDMSQFSGRFELSRLVSQQYASADSIAANIEEGHGRETTREYTRFLVFARGSARETRGRYIRMRHWLPEDVVEDRCKRCDSILAILTKTINTLKRKGSNS